MALTEITSSQRAELPYSAIGLIETTWQNNITTVATCSVVGENDILTAGHCVFNPDRGGMAKSFKFYFGADFNNVTERFDARGVEFSSGFSTSITRWSGAYTDSSNATFRTSESQYDVAILGLSTRISPQTGQLGINFGLDGSLFFANEVGYPSGSTGMMAGNTIVSRLGTHGVYSATTPSIGPGSSGGPLIVGNYVIGVKSAGDSAGGIWADLGFLAGDILTALSANDAILSGAGNDSANLLLGSSSNDNLLAHGGNDTLDGGLGNDSLNGGAGLDTARYNFIRANYTLTSGTGTITIRDRVNSEGVDVLTGIERLQFTDATVALATDTLACQAYRIYKAGFDRVPDAGGLGYWMAKMEAGMDLVSVAANFIHSDEFRTIYGAQPSHGEFITKVYNNVLDRSPDATGYAWWVHELSVNQQAWEKVLADFSESDENQANVLTLIGAGMVYEVYTGG